MEWSWGWRGARIVLAEGQPGVLGSMGSHCPLAFKNPETNGLEPLACLLSVGEVLLAFSTGNLIWYLPAGQMASPRTGGKTSSNAWELRTVLAIRAAILRVRVEPWDENYLFCICHSVGLPEHWGKLSVSLSLKAEFC